MTKVFGCDIQPLDRDTCYNLVTSLRDPQDQKAGWLLAHCDDGVAWGRKDNDGWRFAPHSFRRYSPEITPVNLQQLRIFNEREEILIWRQEAGFLGRRLSDSASPSKILEPFSENWIVLGDRILEGPDAGFTLIADKTGSRQAVPLECTDRDFDGKRPPLTLAVKHYFSIDSSDNGKSDATGVVWISATRLVALTKEVPDV